MRSQAIGMWDTSRTREKGNLNKARVQHLADVMHCSGAGDFCHGCVMGGHSTEIQGICIRQKMGVPSVSYWSVPDNGLKNQVPQ